MEVCLWPMNAIEPASLNSQPPTSDHVPFRKRKALVFVCFTFWSLLSRSRVERAFLHAYIGTQPHSLVKGHEGKLPGRRIWLAVDIWSPHLLSPGNKLSPILHGGWPNALAISVDLQGNKCIALWGWCVSLYCSYQTCKRDRDRTVSGILNLEGVG